MPLELTVRIYSRSEDITLGDERGRNRSGAHLRRVHLNLKWVNCRPPMPAGSCFSPESATDLTVRILPKALPQANRRVVGIASGTASSGAVLLFYDRVVSLRTFANTLPEILGRVLAHELLHLLLPMESHVDTGLMSAHWSYAYLERRNAHSLESSEHMIEQVRANVRQRMAAAEKQNANDRTEVLITRRRQ